MNADRLPGLDQLENTCEILRLLMTGLTEDEVNWKPAPGRFSIAEVLEHLSHTEGHYYRLRIQRMIEEDEPELELYDQEAFFASGQYSGRNAEDSFDHFEDQRELNVEYLREIAADAVRRIGRHPEKGPVTVAQQMHEWAFHDISHIKQIAELIRAIRHYPQMGPFQLDFSINP